MNRHALHRRAMEIAVQSLTRAGHADVNIFQWGRHLYMQADGTIVAVRYAKERRARHRVFIRGKRYEYEYKTLLWNLQLVGPESVANRIAFVAEFDGETSVLLVPVSRLRRPDGTLPSTLKIVTAGENKHWAWSYRVTLRRPHQVAA